MHDRTRRTLCRLLFLAMVVVPTVVVATWSIYANSRLGIESRRERWQQRFEQLLGVDVTVESVRPTIPGTVELDGLRFALPGDKEPLVTIGKLRLTTGEIRIVQLENVHVAASQLDFWVDWLERTTRQMNLDDLVRVVATNVVVDHESEKDTFAEVVGVLEKRETGSQAIFNLWRDESQGDPLALQLVHEPHEQRQSRWILQTGSTPLPVRLLAGQLAVLSRLGSESMFDGQLTCVKGEHGERVELVGKFQAVDLARLSGLPASGMLSGRGQLQMKQCWVLDGSCQKLDAVLSAETGTVDVTWLNATARRWGMPTQQATRGMQEFSDLYCHLELDGNGFRIRGQAEGDDQGALLRLADRVLLKQPRIGWLSVAQMVELLVPGSQEQLPATRHTARLLEAIEPTRLR